MVAHARPSPTSGDGATETVVEKLPVQEEEELVALPFGTASVSDPERVLAGPGM